MTAPAAAARPHQPRRCPNDNGLPAPAPSAAHREQFVQLNVIVSLLSPHSAKCWFVYTDISIKWLPRQARVLCCAKPCAGRWLLSKTTPFQTSELQLCTENGLGANPPQPVFPPQKAVLMLHKPRAGYRHKGLSSLAGSAAQIVPTPGISEVGEQL